MSFLYPYIITEPQLDELVDKLALRLTSRSGPPNSRAGQARLFAFPDESQALAASAVAASADSAGRSSSWTYAIGALSPCRNPNLRMRR